MKVILEVKALLWLKSEESLLGDVYMVKYIGFCNPYVTFYAHSYFFSLFMFLSPTCVFYCIYIVISLMYEFFSWLLVRFFPNKIVLCIFFFAKAFLDTY